MDKSCKCHGVSGSCTVRVCWRTMPKMAKVASLLRRKFDSALRVKLNKNKTKLTRISRGRRGRKRNTNNKRPPPSSLVYAATSPDFCQADKRYGILGTVGRTCNKSSIGTDGCRMLCCGRGYNTVNRVSDVKCNCNFIWCCHVKCDMCKKEWIDHTCKWDWKTSLEIKSGINYHKFCSDSTRNLECAIRRLNFYFQEPCVGKTVVRKRRQISSLAFCGLQQEGGLESRQHTLTLFGLLWVTAIISIHGTRKHLHLQLENGTIFLVTHL